MKSIIFVFNNRFEVDKLLEEIPKYKAVVEKFTTNEIISQTAFCDSFEKELRDGVEGSLATDVFSRKIRLDRRDGPT